MLKPIPPVRYQTLVAREWVAQQLGLPYQAERQDWPWEVAEIAGFEAYFQLYAHVGEDERIVLLEMILEAASNGGTTRAQLQALWPRIEALLTQNADLHATTAQYWCSWEVKEPDIDEQAFAISPYLRAWWRAHYVMPPDSDAPFYRIECTGEKVAVSFDEMHALRKDILLYFDDNAEETTSILLADRQYTLPYWKYLSVAFTQEWAESARYQKLVVEGCLALLHAIALDLLDEPFGRITKEWQGESVERLLLYLRQYNPLSEKLAIAQRHLVRTFSFIVQLTPTDLDESNFLKGFDRSIAAIWFKEQMVQAYFTGRLTT
ncbi:hypothetical protein MTX78_23965 (plasmid) [Hymenobacter tibetensis]|uniref:Uncharacterized protein n=1 Tax=Hymenobacter tibetensis TaxID=497967 RepID=A0ABY4D4F4_9BACT|nr:hypothetical protein [Hymenobacter tibetensis]UOG77403.1 hypothetical protein MTX78_23965 [Hymenobacter tibetensis]